MELWRDLLICAFKNDWDNINFNKSEQIVEIIEKECYKILKAIKRIVEDKYDGVDEGYYKIKKS